ncbi:MAG TPA: hypothetical protein V6C84_17355 [Coleofasciculaceae cyanobacterium]
MPRPRYSKSVDTLGVGKKGVGRRLNVNFWGAARQPIRQPNSLKTTWAVLRADQYSVHLQKPRYMSVAILSNAKQ